MVVTIELAMGVVMALLGLWGAAWGITRYWYAQLAIRDKAIEELRRSFEGHRLYAAENFATGAELTRSLGKVELAIDRLASRFDDYYMPQQRPHGSG